MDEFEKLPSTQGFTPSVQDSDECSSLLHPLKIGRYAIRSRLGKGGFGDVFLAIDEELGRRVAIKVPRRERVSQPEHIEAYLTEARIVANLDHPHIVPVYDVGRTEDGLCFVVSKCIEGSDLAARMKETRFRFHETAGLVASVALALHHAHTNGLVHRDIKPANILVDGAGKAFVADFGLALRDEDFGKGGGLAGTPSYMSPEQARGEGHRVDGRSDIFSLGVILYELLTGRRPFVAHATDTDEARNELLDLIATVEARPPRQIDDRIPKELERICLKAMSKRASERYNTAMDMAEDLLLFGQTTGGAVSPAAPAAPISTPGGSTQEAPLTAPTAKPSDSDGRSTTIVPKGLRSFDEGDAEFFLELLPGPRDREGLPESLRFWKRKIEQFDPDRTFKVALIYGPSGCGKSSLVKAGLVPRLSQNILTVYVEATAEETEGRLLKGLRKVCPELAQDLALVASLASLRRGRVLPRDRKVLLVLDQFEQWLHARRGEENTELVSALRQCDGEHVQVVVMVRDDFAMAAWRFMRELEARIIEGDNFAAVDLFDVDHARNVLAKFGRAFGRLPNRPSELAEEHKRFLDDAARGLAHEGKVICVRLALLAEMVKGKPWVPATLDAVGGATGVGVNYLEESFAGREANPEHLVHQAAARAVLGSLLPEAGTDIKTNMRSYRDLLHASGCRDTNEFDDVLRILDGELRLITPTDPDGFESDSTHDAAQGYYQLTHDYLVQSLRDWLTRKQKETRRGRAELRLSERAAHWSARPANQRLPSSIECLGLRTLTRRHTWNDSERRMMRAAARFHGLRFGAALLLLVALGATLRMYVAEQNRILAEQKRDSDRERARLAVEAVLRAPADAVPYAIGNLEPLRAHAVGMLKRDFEGAAPDSPDRLRAAVSLAALGDVRLKFLLDSAGTAPPAECANLVDALQHRRGVATGPLVQSAVRANAEKDFRLKARLAVLLLQLGEPSVAREMFVLKEDPAERTLLIETLSTWHGAVDRLLEHAADQEPTWFRSGVCSGIGSISPAAMSPSEMDAAVASLVAWYRNQHDGGTHSAAGWALRQWKQPLPEIAPSDKPQAGFQWHVNRVKMTMLLIPAGRPPALEPRDDAKRPDRIEAFWLSDCETSRALFQQFIDDPDTAADAKPSGLTAADPARSPTMSHPVQNVRWYDAILFCNWLSRVDGRTPCYVSLKGDWEPDSAADGYRLPTEVEWEYACRAGAATQFASGNDDVLLGRYAVFEANQTAVCGSKLPNGWGVFDLHGNVYEWCQDRSPPPKDGERVLRGGAFDYSTLIASAGRRDGNKPSYRSYTIGFRVARSNRG